MSKWDDQDGTPQNIVAQLVAGFGGGGLAARIVGAIVGMGLLWIIVKMLVASIKHP